MSHVFGMDDDGLADFGELDEMDELDAELSQTAVAWCPYCGEQIEMIVDPAGGVVQEYVEDCEVCCQPWSVRLALDADGVPSVTLVTLDEG